MTNVLIHLHNKFEVRTKKEIEDTWDEYFVITYLIENTVRGESDASENYNYQSCYISEA